MMNAIENTTQTSHMDLSEDYLARRFNRPERKAAQVTYEVTQDAGYLHQYYLLRDNMFISSWGLDNFSGKADAVDAASETIVARAGLHCVAGCRMTFAENSADISRLAVLPEFESSPVVSELFRALFQHAAKKAASVSMTAPVALARRFREAAIQCGLSCELRYDVADQDEFEGVKMALAMVDFAPASENIHADMDLQAAH